MINYKKIIFFFTTIFTFSSLSFAQDENKIVNEFVQQIESLMNMKNFDDIKRFYNYYSMPNATFIKYSQLLDPKNPKKILRTENLKMSTDEYIKYLEVIVNSPRKYSYSGILKSISNDGDIYNVTINVKDSSLYDNYDPVIHAEYTTYIHTLANCNYVLELKNSKFFIEGMNCSEKINKINIFPNESQQKN